MAFIKTGDNVSVDYFDSDGNELTEEQLKQLSEKKTQDEQLEPTDEED